MFSPGTPPSLSSPSGGQAVAMRREEEVADKVPSSPLDLEGPWGSPTEHKLVTQEEMEVSSRRGGGFPLIQLVSCRDEGGN